jgi:two-component system, LytTR family, sensor kinase
VSASPPEPTKKNRPYWLLIAFASFVPAFLDALRVYVGSTLFGEGKTDWGDVIFAGTEWIFLGALTPITYVLAKLFPLRRDRLVRTIIVHFFGALLLCIAWASLGVLLGYVLKRYPAQPNLLAGYVSWLLTTIPWGTTMYFAVLGCVYAFTYYREARERETQQALLAAQLAEANLSALRMQLHPHFLFNSLNAITVLVRDERIREAARMLELLSGLLRQVLQSEKRQVVTLNEEIQFIEQYLAIEQVRFSDRLQVTWSISDNTRDALVPEFILQPLVENAIRHGIAKRAEAGIVEIVARVDEQQLVLSVVDNGPGYRPDTGGGVGLRNTRTRLETMFGSAAELRVYTRAEGGTVAEIRLPFRRNTEGG